MVFIFPFSKVNPNTKIIIYGAGYVGYDYYKQIVLSKYCDLIKWVDKQFKWYQSIGMPVDSPDSVKWDSIDYVVIAVKENAAYLSIKKYLLSQNLEEEKIVWETFNEWQCDIAPKYSKARVLKEASLAYVVDPKIFISDKRLDLLIRMNYAKDILAGNVGTEAEKKYIRLIEALPNIEEPTYDYMMAYFTEYNQKKGVDQFKKAFQELVFSIKKYGFRKEYFVPIDKNGELINGAHRIAAALANGCDVWIRQYDFEGFNFDFSRKKLKEIGIEIN